MSIDFTDLSNKLRRCGTDYLPELLKKIAKPVERTAIPGSIEIDNLTVPAIFLVCPESDFGHFKVRVPMPQPDFKFRFLSTDFACVIEIRLRFGLLGRKQLILHLNPAAPTVLEFLKQLAEQEVLSFHYYCPATGLLASAFTGLGKEHVEWARRNYDKCRSIHHPSEAIYRKTSESLANQFAVGHRYYKFGGKFGRGGSRRRTEQ